MCMSVESVEGFSRRVLLDGISRNLSYTEIAEKLGVRRGAVIREVKHMGRRRDAGLVDAKRQGLVLLEEEKMADSVRCEERFFGMMGMSLQDKTFLNMVSFYRPELLVILRSKDHESAIRELPNSVRRTLVRNNILTSRGKLHVSERALEELI